MISELAQFTAWRASNLLGNDTSLKRSSENLYGKYCCINLDLPIIYDSKLIDWFNEKSKPIKKLLPDIADNSTDVSVFSSIDVVLNEVDRPNNDIWTKNIYRDFLTDFPEFYQQLMDLFPFRNIFRFSLWSSVAPIVMHRDQSSFLDMPTSFRIMLHDENPRPTLFLKEYLPNSTNGDSDWYNIPRLPTTNSFAWNNLRTKHGSRHDKNYKKILVILQDFEIDWDKYILLMTNSISKYRDHAMISNYHLKDFVKTY